jgi:hypothetical protein
VNNSTAIVAERPSSRESLCGSGNWALGEMENAPLYTRVPPPLRRIHPIASLLILFAATSLSSCEDPWANRQRDRSQLTRADVFLSPRRRRISAAVARTLALEILHRAESERSEMAAEEARHGIDWEEEA